MNQAHDLALRGENDLGGKSSIVKDSDGIHTSAIVQESLPSAVQLPTSEEIVTLRHVGDKISVGAWLVAAIALSERFAFYGVTAPLQNYMQNSRHDPLRPGALGLGQSAGTRLSYFLTFFVYITSFGGAVVADGWLGRYKSLKLFASVYIIGVGILFVTSLPTSLDHGAGLGGLIASIIVIGIGAGGMKPNLAPFMADQCVAAAPLTIKTTSKGERVIVDHDITLQSVYTIFYWCTNFGSLSGVATTLMEKYIGFWAAFLLPFCFLWVALPVLILGRPKFIKPPAQGTILPEAVKALWLGLRGGFKMDAALPAIQAQKHHRMVRWDDKFIQELKRGLLACRVFLPWPFLLLCQSQMSTNLVSQAATMETHGLPNDVIAFFNPVSVMIFLPLAQQILYPALRKFKIQFSPIHRMALGFLLEVLAMAYASIVQHIVYSAGPCYDAPLKCPASPNGTIPNHVNLFIQTPIYIVEGMGEVFSSPASYEYAYVAAPTSMKSLLQSVLVSMGALAVALGFALSPLYKDPLLVISYAVLSGLMFATSCIFYGVFRKHANSVPLAGSSVEVARENMEVRPLEVVAGAPVEHTAVALPESGV
ncbi:POT family-domain-containing protein [Mycena sp. CBHHK59/15]|nr:POT family-domain-containing protein [Mycena sp. CBHHK59/15]